MKQSYVFGRLFAEPSFAEGFASVLDIAGTLGEYNESPTERDADMRALSDDWYAVGQDIITATENYERTLTATK